MSHNQFGNSFEDDMYINYNDGLPSSGLKSSKGPGSLNGFLDDHHHQQQHHHPESATRVTSEPAIIFFASKNETFRLSENYKTFHKKIKNRFHKVIQ